MNPVANSNGVGQNLVKTIPEILNPKQSCISGKPVYGKNILDSTKRKYFQWVGKAGEVIAE
jgi:hypothetical protein